MRKVFVVLALFFLFIVAIKTVRHIFRVKNWHDNDISFQVKENDDRLQIYARYDRDRTWDVQRYLDAQLGTRNMFRNTKVDATITLDDHTSFYIKNTPGRLLIKFDRDDNSEDAYWRMKDLAEGLKEHLHSNN